MHGHKEGKEYSWTVYAHGLKQCHGTRARERHPDILSLYENTSRDFTEKSVSLWLIGIA